MNLLRLLLSGRNHSQAGNEENDRPNRTLIKWYDVLSKKFYVREVEDY